MPVDPLTREIITINEGRIHMLTPVDGSWDLSRCNLGRFVYHDNINRESVEQLIREAEAVFVRTEVG